MDSICTWEALGGQGRAGQAVSVVETCSCKVKLKRDSLSHIQILNYIFLYLVTLDM